MGDLLFFWGLLVLLALIALLLRFFRGKKLCPQCGREFDKKKGGMAEYKTYSERGPYGGPIEFSQSDWVNGKLMQVKSDYVHLCEQCYNPTAESNSEAK